MNGFVKVAAVTPKVTIADPNANTKRIIEASKRLDKDNVELAVFPEMCLTGYTCADLFHNRALLDATSSQLSHLVNATRNIRTVIIVGLPFRANGTLYNVAAVIGHGTVYGLVPKTYIPNYNEFYEKRWWSGAPKNQIEVTAAGQPTLLSTRQLFRTPDLTFGVEICEDLWTPVSPGTHAALAGAEIILNLSASDTLTGKRQYLESLIKGQSARCLSGYVYASAGEGESSTDLVFSGQQYVTCNGRNAAIKSFKADDVSYTYGYVDMDAIRHDRMSIGTWNDCRCNNNNDSYRVVEVKGSRDFEVDSAELKSLIDPMPFVPAARHDVEARCDEIISIQTRALRQRLEATNTRNIVVGISGGLDSTLAYLVAVRTFREAGLDIKGIHAVTMPGFGTTGRTRGNAVKLIETLGTSLRIISIVPAVNLHFEDIGHDPSVRDVTYENSQARQRTLLLMDIANQVGGMVLGTGDMSELALGWATYNGDHMSMYGINAGVPKTLVRHLVENFADRFAANPENENDIETARILRDIIDTPISPELIPADKEDNITQKTEDIVGPYELHDFYLYNMLRYGLSPKQIFFRAKIAFEGRYDDETILRWLRVFVRRFFSQQFKRSCLPDGPKVGSVCLSPRGDWRMPSDACAAVWLSETDDLATN